MDKTFDPTERVSINTHSSIRIAGSKVLYFDPFEIPDEPHDADMIFITHDHYDHFSPDDIRKVKKDATLLIVPEGMKKVVLDKTEFFAKSIIYMKSRQQKEFSRMLVETVPAYNRLKPFHSKGKGWVGYVVTLDDVKYYVAGDTDVTKEALNVRCDVAIVPIGGHYTMDAKDAAKLVKEIHPRYAIPSHYGKIVGKPEDGETFTKLLPRDIRSILKIRLLSTLLLLSMFFTGCGTKETPAAPEPIQTTETAASEEITEAGGDADSKEDAMLTAFSKKELLEKFGKVDTDAHPQALYEGHYDGDDYVATPAMNEPLTGITYSRLLDLDGDGQNELLAFFLQNGHLQYLVFEATDAGVLGTAIGDSYLKDICGCDFTEISVTAYKSKDGMTIEEAGFWKKVIFDDEKRYYSRKMHYDGTSWGTPEDRED
ncbi:MAG: MBL fold metallo-hydrolase, partial [Lachnospiraceae bacterium]|nr:MBL fold metallo-hydrolase [Lachnospiraceae bacterium]